MGEPWRGRELVASDLQGLHVGRVGTVRQEPAVDRRVQRLHLQPRRGHQTVVRPRQRQSKSHVETFFVERNREGGRAR